MIVTTHLAEPTKEAVAYVRALVLKTGYLWPNPEAILKEWFHGTALTWIFAADGVPAGAAHIHWEDPNEPPFGHFCVTREIYGSAGIGAVREVLSWLKKRGFDCIRGIMNRSNVLAVRFAKRLGCEVVREDDTETEVVLWLGQ